MPKAFVLSLPHSVDAALGGPRGVLPLGTHPTPGAVPAELPVALLGLSTLAIALYAGAVLRKNRSRDPRAGLLAVCLVLMCTACATRALLFVVPGSPWSGMWDWSMDAALAVFAAGSIAASATLGGLLARKPSHERVVEAVRSAGRRARRGRAELMLARKVLEQRTAELTVHSRKLLVALEGAGAVACRWEVGSGGVSWEVGFGRLSRAVGTSMGRSFVVWSELIGAAAADTLAERCKEACASGRRVDFEAALARDPGYRVRVSAAPEAPTRGAPVFMVGMFRVACAAGDPCVLSS